MFSYGMDTLKSLDVYEGQGKYNDSPRFMKLEMTVSSVILRCELSFGKDAVSQKWS